MPQAVVRVRVAWVDTDAGGRIHFTAAFRWAEAAETALLRELGLIGPDWASFPRRQVEAEYLRVLVFEDEVEVVLGVERLGTSSITYAWTGRHDGEVYVRGRHAVVHVDAAGRPAPLPAAVRTALDPAA